MAQKVKVPASIPRHNSHKLSSHLCHHTHAHMCAPHPPTIFKVLNEKKRKRMLCSHVPAPFSCKVALSSYFSLSLVVLSLYLLFRSYLTLY